MLKKLENLLEGKDKDSQYFLFDGGFGTYYSEKYNDISSKCEMANITYSKRVLDIHKEYILAGADAIKTNTFGAFRDTFGDDCSNIIREGVALARQAILETNSEKTVRNIHKEIEIFADLGPTPREIVSEQIQQYKEVVDIFLECGVSNFLFETLSDVQAVKEIAKYIKEKEKNSTIVVSFGVMPDGYSREGFFYRDLLERAAYDKNIDAIGLNCVSSALHIYSLIRRLVKEYNFDIQNKPFITMPNAGYPVVRGYRTFFDGNIDYFGEQLAKMLGLGVKILGGCCGTTPRHMMVVSKKIKDKAKLNEEIAVLDNDKKEEKKNEGKKITENYQGFDYSKKVIAVELDSPKNDDLTKFMDGAKRLKKAGVDAITIADCPIARPRMDSSLLACKVKRELGLDVIPHMTCRDRNINATKALLLGISAEGIRNVLIITGDPIPSAFRDEVKIVYQFNSRKLARYVNSLNNELLQGKINIYGALNVNARNFDVELSRAKQKMQEGVCGFLTQPIITENALNNLKKARTELAGAKILGGIIPIVSEKNARFMQSEISGIDVDDATIERYVGKSKEEATKLAVEISEEIAYKIKDYVDGFYLMTPFNRVSIMVDIIDKIKNIK
ncbi:homocysteine S-methyltransferase [Lachnospiraceae bacterium C7]|nr:homocysteine S-methyltransferase [Lachnospiraceae bacterium C7]